MASSISFSHANAGFQAGTIAGSVNTTFYLPSERPETPPRPSAVIPFSRDTDFVERRTILNQIHKKCGVQGSQTALVGLGGVGKSQLAIEFGYRIHEQSPGTWVFWVYASNAARFEESFRDIADCVNIAGRQEPNGNIFKLVHGWLRDSKQRWLLILDNVDDARFLLDGPASCQGMPAGSGAGSKPLREYLPHCQSGSILITTRNKEAALVLVEQRDIITVDPMDEADALDLFEKKLGSQDDNSTVTQLAQVLEYMPLAIVQATAYISQRAPRYSVKQYLEEFKKSDSKRASLLDREAGRLRRDWEAKNSILITWQISFDYIHQTRPSAADLLSLMSFFDRQGIPEALLRTRGKPRDDQRNNKEEVTDEWDSDADESSSQSSASDNEFEDDVVALRDFSFVSVNANATLEMHRLVQLATQKWLQVNEKLEMWKQKFIWNLCEEFPVTGEYENWGTCQTLFAHAKSAAAQRPEEKNSLLIWTELLYRAAWYAWSKGHLADAENLAVKSLKARSKVLGEDHVDNLNFKEMVGLVYDHQGRSSAAEELFVQVIEARKNLLGADDPSTLTTMGNLASTYRNQGRWDVAEELLLQLMDAFKAKLGPDHLHTLTNMAHLAKTYKNQGRWDAAEELLVPVVEMRKAKLGPTHPDTVNSMAHLATIHMNQGRWNEAEELLVQVMKNFKMKFGADHADTLTSMNDLATTYRNQGRWKAAEELEVQIIEVGMSKLRATHQDTADSMSLLATTYMNQGRWDAAENLFVQVIETVKKTLGADHLSTLTYMGNLATIYRKQGRYDASEELLLQVMETFKAKFGAGHPYTLTSMAHLAVTYKDIGRLDAAEGLLTQVKEDREKKLGADHLDTVNCMAHLATTYMYQERWDAAEKLLVRVMENFKTKLGLHHLDTLESMDSLAITYKNLGRQEEAKELQVQVMEIYKTKFGADHPDTLARMRKLSITL